jgi:hypothetical protein
MIDNEINTMLQEAISKLEQIEKSLDRIEEQHDINEPKPKPRFKVIKGGLYN